MKDEIMGLVAVVGWILLMLAAAVSFLAGVSLVSKTAMLIGGGMFVSAFIYAQREDERDGVNR